MTPDMLRQQIADLVADYAEQAHCNSDRVNPLSGRPSGLRVHARSALR